MDVFVLISGYFLSAQHFRLIRVVRLILQTWFYSCAILLFLMILFLWTEEQIPLFASYGMHNYYYRYNSLPILIASVALFLVFQQVQIKKQTMIKIIRFVSPLTLAVYLIHDNPLMRDVIWKSWFPLGIMERNLLLPLKTIGIILLIFTACILIDYLRSLMFALFEKRKSYRKLMSQIDQLPEKLYQKLPD